MSTDDQKLNDLMERLDAWAAKETTPTEQGVEEPLTQQQRSQLWRLCNLSSGNTLSHPLIR